MYTQPQTGAKKSTVYVQVVGGWLTLQHIYYIQMHLHLYIHIIQYLYIYIYNYIYIYIYISLSISIYLSINLSIHSSIHSCNHPLYNPLYNHSIHPSIHPSIDLSIYVSFYQVVAQTAVHVSAVSACYSGDSLLELHQNIQKLQLSTAFCWALLRWPHQADNVNRAQSNPRFTHDAIPCVSDLCHPRLHLGLFQPSLKLRPAECSGSHSNISN